MYKKGVTFWLAVEKLAFVDNLAQSLFLEIILVSLALFDFASPSQGLLNLGLFAHDFLVFWRVLHDVSDINTIFPKHTQISQTKYLIPEIMINLTKMRKQKEPETKQSTRLTWTFSVIC